jgi:CRISP-associated protein Cas1
MFTNKDISVRTIFVINCINNRNLRVRSGELLLEEEQDGKTATLTKLPFQKILALFVIGHISITTPLIDKCKMYNVALIVMKPNLRPVFFWSCSAEANFLLRQKQYSFNKNDISIAKFLTLNKINNQISLLKNTRMKDPLSVYAVSLCQNALNSLDELVDYDQVLGMEGRASKAFFSAYFQNNNWESRKPRAKTDAINVTLDIGYTILFNFIESFIRMFGFDIYIGVYHRLWYKRKSLVCDLIEPFRCIIDKTIRNAYNRKQFKETDFRVIRNEYRLKDEKCAEYYKLFYDAIIPYKGEIFLFVQKYYRCFMRNAPTNQYSLFKI